MIWVVLLLCTVVTAKPWNQPDPFQSPYESQRHILGPNVNYKDGQVVSVSFGVWAPNAAGAYVVPATGNGGRWATTTMTWLAANGTFVATIANVLPGDGYVYQFAGTPSGTINRLDPRAQSIANGTQDWTYSVVHDPSFEWDAPSFELPPPNQVVVYELHIPTFNVEPNQAAGTFASAIEQLPFLQALGVNCIELMPCATFAGAPNAWGYNPGAPYAIMNAFGGYMGLKQFVNAANMVGIGVILDKVWNHADGTNNILLNYDGWAGPAGNGIYFYNTSALAETPWGPRFNYGSPSVVSYIMDNTAMWIEEYHVSGFRWDSTVCIRKGGADNILCWESAYNIDDGWRVLQSANALTHQLTSAFTTAEDDQGWVDITLPVSDTQAGLPGAPGGAGFDSQWGYPFFYALFGQLTTPDNADVDMNIMSQAITDLNDVGGDPRRIMFTENHDQASNQNHGRIPGVIDPGGSPYKYTWWAAKKSMLGIGVLLTAPLYPMLFYGQEMLTYETFNFPVPPALDWGVATANAGLVQEVADMVSLRLNKKGFSLGLQGNTTNVISLLDDSTDKVLVFQRADASTPSDTGVVVVLNMYETQYSMFPLTNMPANGVWYIRFNGDSQAYSPQYSNFGMNQTSIQINSGKGYLMLPQYSIVMLSQ